MKSIKIINGLHLDEFGVQAKTKNGRLQTVHLRQGDLDGACAVYSSMMILIIIGVVTYNDIKIDGKNHEKRTNLGRLKKELMDINGLHRSGNYFFHEDYDNIQEMLQRSFAKKIAIQYQNTDAVENIRINIENDQPVLMSISYKGGGSHALVAIGIECDANDNLTKVLCLDPGYPTPKFTYWNSVINIDPTNGKVYPYRNITESGSTHNVRLDDILIISKK